MKDTWNESNLDQLIYGYDRTALFEGLEELDLFKRIQNMNEIDYEVTPITEDEQTSYDFDVEFSDLKIIQENTKLVTPEKRKKIEDMVLKVMSIIDTTGLNGNRYKKIFASMNDAQFNKFIHNKLNDFNDNFDIQILPYQNDPSIYQIRNAARFLKIPLTEYVYYRHDQHKDDHVRTRYKVPVGYLPIRRLQQILTKKNSQTLDITVRNMKTNQTTGDSKIARISDVETYGLMALDDTGEGSYALKEFLGPRADDAKAKMALFNQIATTGYAHYNDLPHDIESKQTLNTADSIFIAAGLKSDLITNSLQLARTLKNKETRTASGEDAKKETKRTFKV